MKKMTNPSTDERGFTLVEAVVAMMVCTIGLVAMAELMAVTLRLQQLGRNSTSAVRLAQDKVDELTTKNFLTDAEVGCGGTLVDDSVATHNDVAIDDNATPGDATDDRAKGYKRRWVVSAVADESTNLQLRQVTVRVTPDITDNRIVSPFDLTTILRGVSAPCP